MADNTIPLPDIGRRLSSHEQQVLHNIREDMAPVLRRLFPSTADGGRSEFDSISGRFDLICRAVARPLDAKWKKALEDHDMKAMYELHMDVPSAMFGAFREMSKDELILLFVTQLSQQFLERYSGLPKLKVA